MNDNNNNYIEKIESIFNLSTFKLHKSCFILTCILHDKITKDNTNLFSLCILDKNDIITEKSESLDDLAISLNNKSIFVYKEIMKIETFKNFIKSYDGDGFTNQINNSVLRIPNSSFVAASLLDNIAIEKSLDKLIPHSNNNYLLFEYFVIDKQYVQNDDIKLDKLYSSMLEVFNIDLEYFNDRLGNLLVLIPELRVKSKFYGKHFAPDKLFIENYISKDINRKNIYLLIKSEMNNEILDSKIIYPVKDKIVLDEFNKDGTIHLEIWDKSENRIIYRDSGILLKSIRLDIGLISGRRKVIAYDIKRHKKTESDVELITKEYIADKYDKTDISTIKNRRDFENKKSELIKSKELIHYIGNQHDEAIKDIIEIFNSKCENFIYIWDPFFNHIDLNTYLPYIRNQDIIIKIISDFTSKLKNDYKDESEFKNKVIVTINELKRAKINNLEFRYIVGNIGYSFHDRFIITEKNCWMLGSSFNSIGKSHSLIVKINNPEIIKNEFDKLWNKLEITGIR